MKRIVFNLLEQLAREAGCSDEAWEVVAEFAAAEVLLEGVDAMAAARDDVQPENLFEVPAEAMIKCFARHAEEESDNSLDLIDMQNQTEWFGSFDLADWMPSYYDALPRQVESGFGPRAFAELDGRERDAYESEEADDEPGRASALDPWPLFSRKQ